MAFVQFVTQSTDATVFAYRTHISYEADIAVYIVKNTHEAVGDCKWYLVNNSIQATSRIYWVAHEWQADLRVYFVKNTYDAEWLKHKHIKL
jgi:hypothetical protein